MMIKHLNLFGFIIFWIISIFMHFQTKMPTIKISKQDSAINFSKEFLTYFSMGQKRLIADLLWVQTLIESDLEHYSNKDLNSWMFLRFNTISKLDPQFYENYLYGGQYLTIIKDDINGGEIILKKGAQIFPFDFQINFNLGFLYAFELKDFKNAQIVYERIKDSPYKPFNFDSFYAKVVNESLGPKEALEYSLESLKRTPIDSPMFSKIKENIYSLKASIDLECLNQKLSSCEEIDYFGSPYIFQNGKYTTKHLRVNVKININNK